MLGTHSPSDVKNSAILYEVRAGTRRSGLPQLLTYDEAMERQGFISIFGYPEITQQQIRETGTTSGLMGMPLYTDLVYLDFDDADEAARKAETVLQALGIGYQLYSTGGRGWHFHIPCAPLTRCDLVYKVKTWVEANFPGSDTSIYKTSGVIRLPGTWHAKNPGHRKRWIKAVPGQILDLIRATANAPAPRTFTISTDDQDVEAMEVLQGLWLEPTFEGKRNYQIYRRAFLARCAGLDQAEAEEMLLTYNNLMVFPALPDREILQTVRSAFRA